MVSLMALAARVRGRRTARAQEFEASLGNVARSIDGKLFILNA